MIFCERKSELGRLSSMRPTAPDERRRVRVQYVPRGFGLALTIKEDTTAPDTDVDAGSNEFDGDGFDSDDGYLTVVASGVTTLELRRPDGESSMLIWDETEVAWDSLLAS